MKKIYFLLIALIALAGCQSRPTEGKPTITVTIEPLRYFTEAIVGDRYDVVSMVPKGSSPEGYDPTPQQLVKMAGSKAYLQIGYIGFERQWIKKLKENAPDVKFYNLSEGVPALYACHKHGEEGEHELSPDPHTWMSANNARIIAANILKAVTELDRQHKTFYKDNYEKLISAINETDEKLNCMFSKGITDKAFMIYHPTLTYYAREYGLEQVPIEMDGKEPSPTYMKELIEKCRRDSIRIIFIQPEFDKRNAELISEQTRTAVKEINPLNYSWHDEMLRVANMLIK